MKRFLLFLLPTLLTVTVEAATFRVRFEGKQLPGSEVCLFDAKSLDGPLERLTTFTGVQCHPADSDVPLPKGTWNLFARNKDGYVSSRTFLVREGRIEGDTRDIELERAAAVRLGFDLTGSEKVALYVERSGVVLPLVPGERELLAPDGAAVFPLGIDGGAIRWIGTEIRADKSKPAAIHRPTLVVGKRDLAVGVVPDLDAFDRIPAEKRAPGRFELASGDAKPFPATNAVAPLFKGVEALALFRQIPSAMGAGVVRVTGEGWSSTGGQLKEFQSEGPVRVAPTTTLTVRWNVVDDLAAVVEQLGRSPVCTRAESSLPPPQDVPGVSEAGLTLTLARCTGLQAAMPPRAVRKKGCAAVASAVLDGSRMTGSETLNGVAPGVYLLRLGYGKLPAAFETIEVSVLDSSARIELRYDRWFGKVTRDGEPLFAYVGLGEGAVSDPATGEYFTVSIPVPPPPPSAAARMFKDPPPIHVVACDSDVDAVFAPDEAPVPNTRFDIEIVPNRVLLRVIDDKTSKAVAGAQVIYGAMRSDHPDDVLFGGVFGKTDDNGEFTLNHLPQNREIELCALRDDYHRKCASRFVMKDDREREVTIALELAERRTGRVLHPGAGGGRVIWYSPDGRAVEFADLAADGTFTYKNAHAPGEIVAVVSAGAPLLMLRQPMLREGEPFEIQFSAAPVRSFNVVLAREAREVKGFVSLSVGDLVVPLNVLSRHLQTRGVQPLFLAPGEIAMRDIVASGPVSFIFAPLSWAEMYGNVRDIDYFYLPAAGALARVPAGTGATVVVGD